MKLLTLFLLTIAACSSPHTKTPQRMVNIPRVNLLAVEYFSPKSLPEDPLPVEITESYSGEKCELPRQFYEKKLSANLKELRDCLNSIDSGMAIYDYRFKEPPELVLDPDEEQPKCLKKLLNRIPLPRDIYFLSEDDRKGPSQETLPSEQCFSGSFNTHQKTILDSTLLSRALKIQIAFPVSRKLKNDQDTRLWLIVTTLNLLMKNQSEKNLIESVAVPDSICRACFANDPRFNAKKSEEIAPVFYPGAAALLNDPVLTK